MAVDPDQHLCAEECAVRGSAAADVAVPAPMNTDTHTLSASCAMLSTLGNMENTVLQNYFAEWLTYQINADVAPECNGTEHHTDARWQMTC